MYHNLNIKMAVVVDKEIIPIDITNFVYNLGHFCHLRLQSISLLHTPEL